MKWLIRLCLCLPLLAQAQTLTVKVPSRPINDLDNEYQLKLLELAAATFGDSVDIDVPEGIEVKTPDQTTVEISGADKQKVGQLAAEIRRWRKPEPYKGKGIKYRGEYIFRKEGKKK